MRLGSAALLAGLASTAPWAGAEVVAGVTATHQAADGASSETLASADLSLRQRLGRGHLVMHLEGSTAPEPDGVVARHPLANGDAGTALDGDGSGRVQVSELFYQAPFAGGIATAGVIDAARFLDASGGEGMPAPGFANDETTHFLNLAFVNNPAIAFPDYAPGLTWQRGPDDRRLRLLVAGGTGLGDTPNARYGELADLGADGRGVFAATETYRRLANDRTLRLGLWHNSRAPEGDTGVYAVADGRMEKYRWNVRLGLAHGHLALAERFVGLGVGRAAAAGTLGGAIGWLADRGAGSGWQAELYWRFPIGDHWQFTPDLQWLHEPGGRTAVVAGLRVNTVWSRP